MIIAISLTIAGLIGIATGRALKQTWPETLAATAAGLVVGFGILVVVVL